MLRSLALLLLATLPVTPYAQQALQAPPAASAMPPAFPPLPHPALDRIHAANALSCGVAKEEEDYSRNEDHGNRAAFDIDLCKAVATATLGPGARLIVKSYPDEPFAIRALKSGEVDLIATSSLSVARMSQGLAFSAPVLLDGQGFLFPNDSAVHSPTDLAGKKVCFLTGSAAEYGLHRYAEEHKITYIWYPFSEAGEMEAAFFTANCDAITSDLTQLANIRAIDPKRAHEFSILPQTIRRDPLAVTTWAGDTNFSAIVYWTVEALLTAEDLGVTQKNVPAMRASGDVLMQQFLGQKFGTGQSLGIPPNWVSDVITAVGNYGEIFDSTMGPQSSLHLERGENRLTTEGGGLYAEPVRQP